MLATWVTELAGAPCPALLLCRRAGVGRLRGGAVVLDVPWGGGLWELANGTVGTACTTCCALLLRRRADVGKLRGVAVPCDVSRGGGPLELATGTVATAWGPGCALLLCGRPGAVLTVPRTCARYAISGTGAVAAADVALAATLPTLIGRALSSVKGSPVSDNGALLVLKSLPRTLWQYSHACLVECCMCEAENCRAQRHWWRWDICCSRPGCGRSHN